jgi:periplasmic divalent cation tolerance protein
VEQALQVFTTVDTREAADRIARAAVEARVAACAQIAGPISSTYWWEGVVTSDEEWLCILKTTNDRYTDLERVIVAHHPYEVPKVLAVPVSMGYSRYLAWLGQETGGH